MRVLPFIAALLSVAPAVQASPVQKVVQLLGDLAGKIVREGEEFHAEYLEYTEWCEDRSKNLKYEVKTAKSEVEELKATIEQCTGAISGLTAEIEDLAASIATSEADLKAATKIRNGEAADFAASEKELVEVIDALERAIAILERELRKGSSAMIQLQKATGVLDALKALVDASMLGSQDAAKLTALVQGSTADADADGDSDDSFGAPDPAVYKRQSGSIVDTLEGLLDKAKEQLESARTKESTAKHNFEMLKQSLVDEIKFGNQDLDKAKKNKAAQSEAKATAEGDLAVTTKTLAEDEETMSTLSTDCMQRSQDYEAATKSRTEELEAIAAAKKVLLEKAGGAGDITYSFRQASFLQLDQVGSLHDGADLANFEAVRFVRNLAREQHSEALMQLARRMASAMRADQEHGQDPFAKVKGLIKGMIKTLEKDAQADASHKAYCDKETAETLQKKTEKEAELDKLGTQIDSMSATSAQLQEEVAGLQKALAELAASQADMTKIRNEEKAEFNKAKPEMEAGLEGVKMAMKILREYYASDGDAHGAATGAGSSIVGLLEVVESDFSKTLAEMMASESSAQAEYDATVRRNEIEKATKESDVKYKTKEYKQLNGKVAEAKSDLDGVQTELNAIMEYKGRLIQMCAPKAESYSERSSRREAEIAGLKEALEILKGETVLLQRQKGSQGGRSLRGVRHVGALEH